MVSSVIRKMLPNIRVNELIWIPFMESEEAFAIDGILQRNMPEIK